MGTRPLVLLPAYLLGALSCARVGPPVSGRSQDDLVKALLARPAPARDWRKQTPAQAGAQAAPQPTEPGEEADERQPAPEDMSQEEFLNYWRTHRWMEDESLTDASRSRLLEGCEAHPEHLPHLVDLLPRTPEAHDRIRAVYDSYEPPPDEKRDWRGGWKKWIHNWLRDNTRHFREELISKAAGIKFNGHHIEGDFGLDDLARLDWPEARRIIDRLRAGKEQNLRALALKMLYKHARADKDTAAAAKWLEELKRVAEDKSAHGFARNLALEELLLGGWPGSD
ncbi:MAG: hypothetical protein ACYS9X_31035, partial [Planctomycetota bacterium]